MAKLKHTRDIPVANKSSSSPKGFFKQITKNPATLIIIIIAVIIIIVLLMTNANNNNPSGTSSNQPSGLTGTGGAYILQGEGFPSIVNNYPQSLHTKKHHVTAHGGHEDENKNKKTAGTTHTHSTGKTHTHVGGNKKHTH